MDHHPIAATATKPGEKTTAGGTNEIDRLLALGKCKQAVQLAKDEHKRLNSSQSHQQLLRAYLARIEQFQSKGMVQEADALIALVRQRFPEQRDQLSAAGIRAAAVGGRIGELVAPLASDQTPPEIHAEIEKSIRQHVVDLTPLASCDALPAEHPLRAGAAAILRALEAVTAGPVEESQIALPEISHRSPLSGWKLLVRAIAAFYRQDDAACKKALDAIAPDAAVHRLVPTLNAMMQGTQIRQGMAAVLYQRVMENLAPLREALASIEAAFDYYDFPRLKGAIRDAVRTSAELGSAFQERLRQQISIACFLHDLNADEVISVLGITRKDAGFWRLLARAEELSSHNVPAALFWDRFLRHAVHEGMFKENSLEAAAVWMKIADLLSEFSSDALRDATIHTVRAGILKSYYNQQPPEIAALAPKDELQHLTGLFDAGAAYQRALAIDPDPAGFQRWWEWGHRTKLAVDKLEDIANRWHEKNPRDARPLLHLSQVAEKRKALKLALDRLSAAEQLDPLNPQVRQARVRLTLATLYRHFKQKKPDLVAKDLAELEALPAMQEPDRVAFILGLRAAWRALRKEPAEAQQTLDSLVEKMGRLAGSVIFQSIARKAGIPQEAWPKPPDFFQNLEPREVLAAEARAVRISFELDTPLLRPISWNSMMDLALQQRPVALGEADLLRVGRAAILWTHYPRAYLASTAGLSISNNPTATARFLLLRSRSLWYAWMKPRAVQCLRAALELARQAHDEQLISEIVVALDEHEYASRAFGGGAPRRGLDTELLAEVLKCERSATDFPHDPDSANKYLVEIDAPQMTDDQEQSEEEDFEDTFGDPDAPDMSFPPNLSPADIAKIDDFLKRRGITPEQLMGNKKLLGQLLAELVKNQIPDLPFDQLPWEDPPFGAFGGGGFGKRKKRRKK